MSAVKLLKKDELNMSTGIKNSKHHTISIYITYFFILVLVPCHLTASASGSGKDGKWVIVIDPGHGGKDPGALGAISKEKNINLAIALLTGEYIKQNCKNATVIYTRDNDSTVDLIERPKIANRNKADLFISIHSNLADSKSVMGAETWIMGLASSEENLKVAMKENEVILLEEDHSTKYLGFDPNSPESYIIFTLTQNVYQKQSLDLAWKIQRQFTERVNRKDRSVKQAGFWVLYNTSMPSVLVETGFISNPAEEKYLNSKSGQEYLASAIFRACRDYMDEIDRRSRITAINEELPPATESQVKENNLPAGEVVFMVQVNTTSAKVEIKPENFRGLADIVEISADERFRYASGNFKEYTEAVKYRKKVEAIYPDAFVIAVKDNKVLPLQQALEQKRKK